MRRLRRTIRSLVPLMLVAGVGLVLTPALARAHLSLTRSSPAKDATLVDVPRELRLTFSAAIEHRYTRLRLIAPDGRELALGDVRLDSARTIVAGITSPLVSGRYTVAWQVAGADGHPVRGDYVFTIDEGAAGAASGSPADTSGLRDSAATAGDEHHHDPESLPLSDGFDAGSPAYVGIRWLQFTALLVVLGGVAFHLFVVGALRRGPRGDSPLLSEASGHTATLALGATITLGVSAVLRLVAQGWALGGAEGLHPASLGGMLTGTTWGWGWIIQVAGVIAAAIGFARVRRGDRSGWTLGTIAAVVLAFTPALSGHAAATPGYAFIAVLTDALHVIGAGGWLGSLLFVLGAGMIAARRMPVGARVPAVADLVNAYSPTALAFAGLAATTGVFAAWLHVGGIGALWSTPYGRTLLLKLALLSVAAGTGAYNWRRVRPALGDVAGERRLRRSATLELTAGAVVVLVTAVLVAMPTARDEPPPVPAAAQR